MTCAHSDIESELPSGLTDNPLITIVPLPLPPTNLRDGTLPFFFAGPCKVLWQIWTLFYVLCYTTKPARWLLVQVTRPALTRNNLLTILEPSLNSHLLRRIPRLFDTQYSFNN